MIFEKWPLGLSIDKLQAHLYNNVINKEISRQSAAFGGWSVLSSNGDYKDGWQQGHLLFKNSVVQDQKDQIRKQIPKKFSEFTIETEICTEYLLEVINLIRKFDLNPYRARIICLTAHSSSSWHRDSELNTYAVRLHIPIITNDKCFFETHQEREHAPADGSGYFVYVNREHRVVNDGDQDRYHLVMDVKDTKNITKFHRWEDFENSVGEKQ